MRLLKRILYPLALVLLFGQNVHADGEWLEPTDVKTVMRRIFEYHVDEKRMTAELLTRAMNIYIDQFDPQRLYLLESEVQPYITPSHALVNQLMQEYHRGELSIFADLDELFENALERNRQMRDQIELNPEELFADIELPEAAERYPKAPFAENLDELFERSRLQLQRFVQRQIKRDEDHDLAGLEAKVIDLYERNLRGAEDKYLFIHEDGRRYTDTEREHHRTLRALKAMAKSLDSHTAFFSAQEAYDMRVRLEKGFHGIGIVLQEEIEGITVVRLIEGGPAERSGLLQAQDRIVEVDGEAVDGYSFDKVLDMVRGPEGSSIILGILRESGDQREFFNVELRRERITMNDSRVDVSYEEVEDGIIGKIVLHSFYDGENGISSERDIRNAIRDLYQIGNLKGVILDLRENTGGFLMQAVKVAGLFITNGVVVISKYSDGETRYFRDIDGHAYYSGPLILLTSKASASAAEIVAQTLQDYGAALIVGDERTYGKGSIQHQTVTGQQSDSFFKVTVGRYYTVSGRSTQIRGVQADIVVPSQFSGEQLGEKYLSYPLAYGEVDPAFADGLLDIDPAARRWYLKYYMPSLQPRIELYRAILPVLRERSQQRLEGNATYQAYLRFAGGEDPVNEEEESLFEELLQDPDKIDPPMAEATQIMQDMIMLLPNSGSLDSMFAK